MSEHEKRLRKWIVSQRELSASMKTTLVRELDGALAAARDAALEEAERLAKFEADESSMKAETVERDGQPLAARFFRDRASAADTIIFGIRALRSQPAQVIPVAKVREALDYDEDTARAPPYMRADEASAFENGWAAAIRCVEDRLGVPLDAETEAERAFVTDVDWREGPGFCTDVPPPPTAPESERCVCGHARHPGMTCPRADWRKP